MTRLEMRSNDRSHDSACTRTRGRSVIKRLRADTWRLGGTLSAPILRQGAGARRILREGPKGPRAGHGALKALRVPLETLNGRSSH
jgi:hypothetical protein